ncbi:MAG: hypothetical protein J2P46_07635 [Zavarzinella sp.]|nr:hypothetical protein [Zavarzinella sp.]
MVPVLASVSILVIGALVCVVAAIRIRATRADDFPPISDAEFLARCKPGTSPEVALKVRRIVAKTLAVEYERVYPSSRFVDDLAAD